MHRFIFSLALVALLCVGLSFPPPPGTTYYVDTNADPGGDGTTTALTGANCAWDTIADVNAASFAAGDSILISRGTPAPVYREQLTVPSSGSAGLPITFGAYGTGDDPIIKGSNIISTWTAYSATFGPSQIVDTNNDCDEVGDLIINLSGTDGDGDEVSVVGPTDIGWRFPSVTIPKGSNITAATVTPFRKYASGTNAAIFKGIAEDNTAVWSAGSRPSQRTKTSATVSASLTTVAYPDETFTAMNDISAIIEEIVGRSGWSSGNALGIVLEYVSGGEIWAFQDYANNNAQGAKLTVTYEVPNVWQATVTTQPRSVYFDGVLGTNQTSIAALATARDWYWASNVLYVYAASDPDSLYVAPGIEAPKRNYCISSNSKTYFTIQYLNLQHSNINGILINSDNNIVQNCTLLNHYSTLSAGGTGGVGVGILINGSSDNSILNNTIYNCDWGAAVFGTDASSATVTMSGNVAHDISFDGLSCYSTAPYSTSGLIFEYNTCYNCSLVTPGQGAGIHLTCSATGSTGTGNIVRYNLSYNNGVGSFPGYGIGVDQYVTNVAIYYNIAYGSRSSGIHMAGLSGCTIYNNTLYNNCADGTVGEIELGSNAAGVLIRNNVVYASTDGRVINAVTGARVGHTINYNCYYGGSATPFHWGTGNDYAFADWKTAATQDANSISFDPLLTSLVTPTFTLLAASPCINAGTDVGLQADYAGHEYHKARNRISEPMNGRCASLSYL